MDEILTPFHRVSVMNRKNRISGKETLALMLSLAAFSAAAENTPDPTNVYTGNYQSYFYDETHNHPIRTAPAKKEPAPPVSHVSSSPVTVDRTAEHAASPVPATLSPAGENNITDPELSSKVAMPADVSLLRLRQEDPPVHWNSIGRNMEAGGLHGNIGTQIEIDDVRWRDKSKNSGKFKLATIQAFLRHDELPNWYFGFWNAREDSYKGQFSNQKYDATNTINEFFVGHIFETWRGNIGTEAMIGSETATKRWKNRFKVWQDLRLSNKWSLAGYAYGEYQPQGNEPGNGDLEQYIFETEPAIQYRVNPDMGLYLRPYYYYNRQVRENWGDIVEVEWKVTAGLWRNWYPLLTSLYVGFGQDKTENASNANEVFYNGRYKFIGGTLSYPVFSEVRLYGEFRAEFTKEDGLWTYKGHSWNPFTVVGVNYNF